MISPMRVLVLCQYYRPEPIFKAVELAEELKRRGHSVSVITGFPHYPQGTLYDGYHARLLTKEIIEGIPVTRTYEYAYHGPSALRRIINYFSFALSAPLGLLTTSKCDVMYVRHPPLTIGIAAWIISRLWRIPYVYDVEDIWPESAIVSGVMKEGRIVKLMFALEKFVYKRANRIIVVTADAKANLVHKGVAPEKVVPMPKWVDDSLFTEVGDSVREDVRRRYGWSNRFVVMFAGNIGYVQHLETVVDAVALLPADTNICVAFIGDGSDRERLEQIVHSKGLAGRAEFLGRQPQEVMGPLMAGADALLVHLKDSELANYVIPAKTLAYLAAGKPIIMAMAGASSDLVRAADAGVVLPSENAFLMAEAMLQIERSDPAALHAMGVRGREHLKKLFTKTAIIDGYEQMLHDLIGSPPTGAAIP